MVHPGLTAVLIVRDAARWLPGCLESLTGVDSAIDDICVLDTGSVDDTLAIARATPGVRTDQGPWRDDFSDARNRALAMARTDWVLSVDADERLVVDPSLLRNVLHQARRKGLDMLVLDVVDIRDSERVSTARIARLLNATSMRFRNRVHEVPARVDGSVPRGALVDAGTVHLRHLGYDSSESMLRRRERNVALATLEVDDRRRPGTDPEDLISALVNLGRSRASAGAGAARGVDVWLEAWGMGVDSPFRLWAGELAVAGLTESGQLSGASGILAELARAGCDERQLAWLTGRVFRAAGRRSEALGCFRLAEGRVTAMGERPSDVPVLVARLELEVAEREFDAAARTASRLIGEHRRYGDVLSIFLELTQARPEAAARELGQHLQLREADGLVSELSNRGTRGSRLLRALSVAGYVPHSDSASQPNSDDRENRREKASRHVDPRR